MIFSSTPKGDGPLARGCADSSRANQSSEAQAYPEGYPGDIAQEAPYSYEDVQGILALALEQKGRQDDGLSREQFLEIAADLNLSATDLQMAEVRWRSQERDHRDRRVFDQYRQSHFHQHALRYVIVNGFLVVLNSIATGGISIALFIAVWWGLGLALEAQRTYLLRGAAYEKRFQRWQQRQQLQRSLGSLVNWAIQGRKSTLSLR